MGNDLRIGRRVCVIAEWAPPCRTGRISFVHGIADVIKGFNVVPDDAYPDSRGYSWAPTEIVTIETFEAAVIEYGDTRTALHRLRKLAWA